MPRDIASRAAKNVCDEGRGVGPGGLGVYLDFADAIKRLGRKAVEAKYGNLFDMYAQITGENPYETPMRIYPAVHYTMGGLWVDYDLQSTIPGLFVDRRGQLLRSRGQPARAPVRLMQGLADGYFVLPNTINDYLAAGPFAKVDEYHPAAAQAVDVGAAADRQAAVDQRHPDRRLLPQGARPHHVGLLRDGAHRGGSAQGDHPDPRAQGRSSGPTSRCSAPATS